MNPPNAASGIAGGNGIEQELLRHQQQQHQRQQERQPQAPLQDQDQGQDQERGTQQQQAQQQYHRQHQDWETETVQVAADLVASSRNTPTYLHTQPGFVATFTDLLPPPPKSEEAQKNEHLQRKVSRPRTTSSFLYNPSYALSLLSVSEFTVTAIPHPFDITEPIDLQPPLEDDFRPVLEEICADGGVQFSPSGEKAESESDTGGSTDGKPVFEEAKWRIPLDAYQRFHTWITSTKGRGRVEGIPDQQLKVATLGRQRMDRSYPSVDDLMAKGVPAGIANALAPFQRGGVDFCLERNGRALVADEMGLGKSIQAIAAMSCYDEDWPLLVLCPSTARYHWEAEFRQWLGKRSSINKKDPTAENEDRRPPKKRRMKSAAKLLRNSEIHVINSSKDDTFVHPDSKIRVVICSYGLVLNLIAKDKLYPGAFKAVIVDESHMLKDKSSKRTKSLLPILRATKWCLMLSGTPALAKARDLWAQLNILGATEGQGGFGTSWWQNEEDFLSTYVKGKNKRGQEKNFAQLHTLLTSTVMIRRTKADMLKNLPPKRRSQLSITVTDAGVLEEFEECMRLMRTSNGALGKIARANHVESRSAEERSIITDPQERRNVLNKMYTLTGNAKIPVVASMLKRRLADPTSGKVCIFAHHISVLDGIISGACLSNDEGSNTKYIRIDGSTLPKSRQEYITTFQNDPTTRVAILGVTAASVAVTLTAASTVWFAELFWTPAIMLQAEDRCHRIGQQSTVQCTYFHAKGSLDDLLWKLVEQKYRDLGEFVEGKEKVEMTVNAVNNYEEEKKTDEVSPGLHLTENDELHRDIVALGMEEEDMLRQASDESEDDDNGLRLHSPEASDFDTSMPLPGMLLYKLDFVRSFGFVISPFNGRMIVKSKSAKRLVEMGANVKPDVGDVLVMINGVYLPRNVEYKQVLMMLKNALTQNPAAELVFAEGGPEFCQTFCRLEGVGVDALLHKAREICPSTGAQVLMAQKRMYSLHFSGNYGITIQPSKGKMVVKSKSARRIQELGEHSKPSVGDALVAVNGRAVHPGTAYMDVLMMLKTAMMQRVSAELTFEEYPPLQSSQSDNGPAGGREKHLSASGELSQLSAVG